MPPNGEQPEDPRVDQTTPMNMLTTRLVAAIVDNTRILAQVGQVLAQVRDCLDGVKERYGILDFLNGVEGKLGLMALIGEAANETNGLKDEFWLFNRAMELMKENKISKPSWSDFCRSYYEALDDDEKRKEAEEDDADDADGGNGVPD